MTRRSAILSVFLVGMLFLPSRAMAADRYYAPPPQVSAAFQIMDMGLANIFGLFKNATGSFTLENGGKSLSHVRIAIDSASMALANGSASDDLEQLFGVDDYPEITFMATAASPLTENKGAVKGTLTIHGVSKPATFEVTLNRVGGNPFADSETGHAAGLSLRGSFKRADFRMGDQPEMPGRFGDSVTLLLDLQAVRQ